MLVQNRIATKMHSSAWTKVVNVNNNIKHAFDNVGYLDNSWTKITPHKINQSIYRNINRKSYWWTISAWRKTKKIYLKYLCGHRLFIDWKTHHLSFKNRRRKISKRQAYLLNSKRIQYINLKLVSTFTRKYQQVLG